ncbi:hypothetical protein MmTuc01_0408 [Methanosarcina mazei Tuc01]|uniref:Uncharacterized protein n=1 Tax=Methanosarcina mazei Tuc01 TaxID=1236903 RepID=M1Q6S8_METMZ|nr:UPF0228 family protein [Methanosarcina mazei]AGF95848.1 hypothetical protein MmTuc01_0408 [Methanosarcina mazei Tuc01]
MNKISKVVLVFIVILTIVILIKQSHEVKVAALFIQFENETTEPEVEAILENYDIPVNYTIDCNSNISRGKYYIKADEDKINELRKDENWTSVVEIKKGNYNIGNGSPDRVVGKNCVLEKDAIRIKNELEKNEKVLIVGLDYIQG